MLLVNRLNNINSQIESYQEQIAELQRRVTELQAHAQEVQGAESAAESAIVQIRTALDMLTAICPDEIPTFKAAVDALFATELPQLPANIETATPTTSEPVEPNPPTNDEIVDVESTPVEEKPETNDNGDGNGYNGSRKGDVNDFIPVVNITSTDGNGNGKKPESKVELVTQSELKKHKRPLLIKLANIYGIPGYNNKTRDQLAHLLAGKVTRKDLQELHVSK